ncbi:MAG: FHA domain-containing protein [Anaeromyxobacter sp.]|nr:FHA domain-containing protein [Anaeromyxobacter sp.]
MKLVIEDDAGTRMLVPFTSEELTLGRAATGVGWRLPDRNVSRRHARFSRSSGGAIFVEDLGSLTGTWLNGERVSGKRKLRPGDLVEIGHYDLMVLPDGAEAAGPGTPPPLPAVDLLDPAVVQPAPSAPPAATAPGAAPPRPAARRRLALAAALVAALLAGLLLARLAR